ncbi:MAG: hypothetical protein ACJ8GV_10015 [Luteimonas sp.]
MAEKIVLRGEQAAWDLLERALNKDPRLEGAEVSFSGWPKLEITLRGRNLEGTIPARFLPALQEYQESVYKLYSYAKYKEYGTRRLKDHERRELELVFKVEKGSSEFIAQAGEVLQKIGVEAATKMTPMQLTVFLCLVALLFAGHSGFKLWLKHKETKLDYDDRKSTRESASKALEAAVETNRQLISSNERIRERDAERDALLKAAVSGTKSAKLAFESAEAAYTRLALSMEPNDNLVVDGVELSGKKLKSAVTAPRQASELYSQEGPAILKSVENDVKKGYIVGVKFLDADFYLNPAVEHTRLTDEEVQCVSKAIFSRKAIWVHVEGRWRRGNVEAATIMSVRELTAAEKKLVPESQGGTKRAG